MVLPPFPFLANSEKKEIMTIKSTDGSAQRLVISNHDDYQSAIATLSAHTTRFIRIYSADLPTAIFDNNDFIDVISAFARKSRHSTVQIIIENTHSITQRNQRLLNLHHRLSTIQVRLADQDYRCEAETYFIFDSFALIEKPHTDTEQGLVYFNSPREATRKLRQFHEAWDHATVDDNLRQQII